MSRFSKFSRLSQRSKPQKGWLLFEAGIAIILSAALAGLTANAVNRASLASAASSQGENIKSVALAAENLVGEFYDSFQAGLPITRNGITLPCAAGAACEAVGQARAPTLDNLRAMALGITPSSNFGSYKTLSAATYITAIRRVPVNCETVPDPISGALNGSTCNITGLVCMDRPVQPYGAPVGITDDFGIGAMLGKIGADSGTSMPDDPAIITGANDAWSAPNPFAGNPIGIVCVRFGFGSASMRNFLRVNDARNPNFQNDVTVGGNIFSRNGTVGAGTGTAAGVDCRLGEILNSGAFWSRSATCIRRALVDGAAGEISVADAAGVTRAAILSTGDVVVSDAAGTANGGIFNDGAGNSQVRGTSIQTNAASAGLRANGESFANSIVINSSAVVGAACPTNNATVWGAGANNLRLLKCVANIWLTTGTTVGAVGGACPVNDEIGETSTKTSIICVGGFWQTTTSRIGRWAMSSTEFTGHGTVVTKPTCGSGSTPKMIEVPKLINATYVLQNFDLTDNGPSWTVSMTGSNAGDIAWGTAIAQVGCWYP